MEYLRDFRTQSASQVASEPGCVPAAFDILEKISKANRIINVMASTMTVCKWQSEKRTRPLRERAMPVGGYCDKSSFKLPLSSDGSSDGSSGGSSDGCSDSDSTSISERGLFRIHDSDYLDGYSVEEMEELTARLELDAILRVRVNEAPKTPYSATSGKRLSKKWVRQGVCRSSSISRVGKPPSWPEGTRQFTYRYMHENELYHIQREDKAELEKFARELERHLGIKSTMEEHEKILSRCLTFVGNTIEILKRDRVLIEKKRGNPIRINRYQTAVFREAWESISETWHRQNPPPRQYPGDSPFEQNDLEADERERGSRRQRQKSRSISPATVSSAPSGYTASVQIPVMGGGNSKTLDTGSKNHSRSPPALAAAQLQTASPTASLTRKNRTKDDQPPLRNQGPSDDVEQAHHQESEARNKCIAATTPPPSDAGVPESHESPQAGPSSFGIRRGRASCRQKASQATASLFRPSNNVRDDNDLQPQGSTEQRSESVLNRISNDDDGNRDGAKNTPATPLTRSTIPAPSLRLHFLFKDPNKALDLDNPLSRRELFGKSVAELFDHFCQRTNLSLGSVDRLTFRCLDWADGQVFLLCDSDEEQVWMDIQRRLNVEFGIAKGEFDDDEVFLVVVKRGDVRKRKRAAETYDD